MVRYCTDGRKFYPSRIYEFMYKNIVGNDVYNPISLDVLLFRSVDVLLNDVFITYALYEYIKLYINGWIIYNYASLELRNLLVIIHIDDTSCKITFEKSDMCQRRGTFYSQFDHIQYCNIYTKLYIRNIPMLL